MTKVYNVWLEIEEIDEEHDDNGNDLSTIKLGRFVSEKDAMRFNGAIVKMVNAVVKMFPGLLKGWKIHKVPLEK